MKLQEIHFKCPVKVLQVFFLVNRYGKEEKSFVDRKEKLALKPVASISGHVKEGALYLPDSISDHPGIPGCDLITLEDDLNTNPKDPSNGNKEEVACNRNFSLFRPVPLHIFDLKSDTHLELHLRYGLFEIGLPSRENFKICELKKEEPVEIRINGKLDHSMSSGRQRQFKEQLYVFHYLGDFDSAFLLKPSFPKEKKTIPAKRKQINLLKPLW